MPLVWVSTNLKRYGNATCLRIVYICFGFLKAKMARLKQAKEEAETEVAEHKTSTEHGFQRKLEEVRLLKKKKKRVLKLNVFL